LDKRIIIGVDEVGCGCIAGPIVVAAVAAYEDWTLPGLRDSKKLSAKKREELVPTIAYQTIAQQVIQVDPAEIDKDFQEALLSSMRKAVYYLVRDHGIDPHYLLVIDGSNNPYGEGGYTTSPCELRIEPKADDKYPAVSAASVIAKVNRDAIMTKLGCDFPGYKFAQHKGYPTKEHKELLEKLGPCIHHRRSSAPVRAVLEKRNEKRTSV
jgi:ribonuclease HII